MFTRTYPIDKLSLQPPHSRFPIRLKTSWMPIQPFITYQSKLRRYWLLTKSIRRQTEWPSRLSLTMKPVTIHPQAAHIDQTRQDRKWDEFDRHDKASWWWELVNIDHSIRSWLKRKSEIQRNKHQLAIWKSSLLPCGCYSVPALSYTALCNSNAAFCSICCCSLSIDKLLYHHQPDASR